MTAETTNLQVIIERIFNKILEFPLYKENPSKMCLNEIISGISFRQSGNRKTRIEHDYGDAIYNFFTFVVIDDTYYDETHNMMRTDIVDMDEGYISIILWENDLRENTNPKIVTTVDEEPLNNQDELFVNKEKYNGNILLLKYWEKVKTENNDNRMCFRFSTKYNRLSDLQKHILETQIFVFSQLLKDPIPFAYCRDLEPYLMFGNYKNVDAIIVDVFNKKFRNKVLDILTERLMS